MKYIKTDRLLFPEVVAHVARTPLGATFQLEDEILRAEFIRPDILRLKMSRGNVFDEQPTFACSFELPHSADFELDEDEERVTLKTSRLLLRVGKKPFSFDVYRPDGSVVFEGLREKGEYRGYGTD